MSQQEHRPLSHCPVCGDSLTTTRLSCGACGTEIAGHFRSCEFCALDEADYQLVKVFLGSRGNVREIEKHLGVSYPTARARLSDLLGKLGLGGEDASGGEAESAAHESGRKEEPLSRESVLAAVAAGTMPLETATLILDNLD